MEKDTAILMGFSEDEIIELINILETYRINISNDKEVNLIQQRFRDAFEKIQNS